LSGGRQAFTDPIGTVCSLRDQPLLVEVQDLADGVRVGRLAEQAREAGVAPLERQDALHAGAADP